MSWSQGVFTREMERSVGLMKLEMQMEQLKMGAEAAMLSECIPAPQRVTTSKCAGCGSHEWRQHNNVRICAYCRSGQ